MTTPADIEALGIEVPKTKKWDTNGFTRTNHSQSAAAITELLAVIERLVRDNDSIDKAYKERYQQYLDTKKRAKQAESDLALARYQPGGES